MPKDEFDPEDPLELRGMSFVTGEDTCGVMTECFTEEFLRMGYTEEQVWALFRDPFYMGANMVLENKGEEFVKRIISETFAKFGAKL